MQNGQSARYTGALATEEQLEAERLALRVYTSPEMQALRPQIRAIMEADAVAKTPDGAAQLEHALDLWIMGSIMWQICGETVVPKALWATDNSPHDWFGHHLPGAGGAGDNPDFIYRNAFLDGAYEYELKAKLGARRPSQVSFELVHGGPSRQVLAKQTAASPDLGNQVSMVMSDHMHFEPDGSFTITLGPDTGSTDPNYLKTAPGPLQLVMRDSLADWNEDPTEIAIRRTSGPADLRARTQAEVVSDILAGVVGYVEFWSGFKNNWLGGIADNKYVGPVGRAGGWGFLVGGRFNLGDDDAIAITIEDEAAGYVGLQLLSPWLMMPGDTRKRTISFNKSQMHRNADNSITFVISVKDPGVTNWLDTSDMHQGMYIFRWQKVPPSAATDKMIKSFQLVKFSELAAILPASVPRVDAAGRIAQIAQRHLDFDNRLGTRLPD